MGVMTAPVTGSGSWPAWMARVPKRGPPFGGVSATRGPGDRARLAVHLPGALRASLAVPDDAEMVVRLGVVRVGLDRALERLGRLVDPVEVVEAHAQVVMAAGLAGSQLDRLPELGDRLVVEPLLAEDDAELPVRGRVVGLRSARSPRYPPASR